jgi:nitrite reductase/ring-hydroxylating ferredoxin subunit
MPSASTGSMPEQAAARQVVVGTVDEIPPGASKIVEVDGRSIGIFNLDGEYFAVRNACPHAGGALCEGVRSGFVLSARPGQYEYVRRGEILRCPWHQWEFDIRTGRSWIDPGRVRVLSYELSVTSGSELLESGDRVEVADDKHGKELFDAGLRPGPFVVETFPVQADQSYVVLSI